MKARIQVIVVGMFICLASSLSVAPAAMYDVAADFSATNNPNGPWTYGWSSTLTSALDLYSYSTDDRSLNVWSDSVSGSPPSVVHNGTTSDITLHPEEITWQAGQFALHPGANGEYSHARWTAPYAGTLHIDAMFTALAGATTDVHVLHNGGSLFDGLVDSSHNASWSSTNISFGMGDTIDFAVGFGTGGYGYDTTGLSATIYAVPAPAGVLLGWLGLGTAGWFLRRKTA